MKPWLFVLLLSVFNSAFASLDLLKSHLDNKQYRHAIKIGEALKKQNPNSASVLFYSALAYQNDQQLELAKADYLKAIQLKPNLPELYNNLASIYVIEKDYTKAAETLTTAINSQPNIATAYANLSQIYRHLASQAYQEVLNEEIRSKKTNKPIKTQLLTQIDLNETIAPIINFDKPKTRVVKVPKAMASSKQQQDAKPTSQNLNLASPKEVIINWAKAWKTKQFNAYIQSYTVGYAPKNLNHQQWLKQREKRIKRPGSIKVTVNNFDIKFNNNKAYVNFDQSYQSATYQDKVRKRMHLMLVNKHWRITSEVTLSVL